MMGPYLKKQKRMKSRRLPIRAPRFRVHYVKPDPDRPHRVQVLVSACARHMHATIEALEGDAPTNPHVAGMVRHYTSKVTGRFVVRPGLIIARMFLNARDLRANPAEIISHECVHAGMAWARLQSADLSKMDGEEVMAYATGRMTRQVNYICHRMRIFG